MLGIITNTESTSKKPRYDRYCLDDHINRSTVCIRFNQPEFRFSDGTRNIEPKRELDDLPDRQT